MTQRRKGQGRWFCVASVVSLVSVVLLSGCSLAGASNACGTSRANALVDAAKRSPLLTDVPPDWRAEAVYGECDRDDEIVSVGRRMAVQQTVLERYLQERSGKPGVDDSGLPCRTVLVSGVPFYVSGDGVYLELRHYLTFDNLCRAVTPAPG